MSDPVKCDHCGKRGTRRRGMIAPEDWLFAEVVDEDTRETCIVYACSVACSRAMWQSGPGCLAPSEAN